jgi:hypothetical protein
VRGGVGESEVLRNAFELLSAFDEVISLGHRERVGMTEVRAAMEMESHEERIQDIIARNKEQEAKEELKRRAKQLEMQRREMLRRGQNPYAPGGCVPSRQQTAYSTSRKAPSLTSCRCARSIVVDLACARLPQAGSTRPTPRLQHQWCRTLAETMGDHRRSASSSMLFLASLRAGPRSYTACPSHAGRPSPHSRARACSLVQRVQKSRQTCWNHSVVLPCRRSGSHSWWVAVSPNRVFHCAVPMF